jgi:hypothetical protein
VTGRRRLPRTQIPPPPDPRAILARIAIGYAVINTGSGVSYLLGGPATSPSLRLLQSLAPMQVWGTALAVSGALGIFGTLGHPRIYPPAYLLGLLVWTAWAASAWLATLAGTITSAGGPWIYTGMAGLHFIALRWRHQDVRSRQ